MALIADILLIVVTRNTGTIHTKNIRGGMKMSDKTKNWAKAAGIRSLKTVAQTAAAMMSTAIVMQDINWMLVLSASILAGILSLLTSVAGLPELKG